MITEYPLKSILGKTDLSGRVAKWAVQLGEFDIRYEPRRKRSSTSHFLADFPWLEVSPAFTSVTDLASDNHSTRGPDRTESDFSTRQVAETEALYEEQANQGPITDLSGREKEPNTSAAREEFVA